MNSNSLTATIEGIRFVINTVAGIVNGSTPSLPTRAADQNRIESY